jgi:hypothetical protein
MSLVNDFSRKGAKERKGYQIHLCIFAPLREKSET